MRRFRILILSVLLFSVVTFDGCRKNINTHNPQVVAASTFYDASTVVDTIADGLVAARHLIDNLETTEPDYYAHIKPLLQNTARANDKAIAAIRVAKTGDTSADWKAAVLAVSDAAGKTDLTQFGFKNPDTQTLVRAGFATLQAGLALIPQKFGGR